jgi:hypothetical protein
MILTKNHAKQLLKVSRFLDNEAFEEIVDNKFRADNGIYS